MDFIDRFKGKTTVIRKQGIDEMISTGGIPVKDPLTNSFCQNNHRSFHFLSNFRNDTSTTFIEEPSSTSFIGNTSFNSISRQFPSKEKKRYSLLKSIAESNILPNQNRELQKPLHSFQNKSLPQIEFQAGQSRVYDEYDETPSLLGNHESVKVSGKLVQPLIPNRASSNFSPGVESSLISEHLFRYPKKNFRSSIDLMTQDYMPKVTNARDNSTTAKRNKSITEQERDPSYNIEYSKELDFKQIPSRLQVKQRLDNKLIANIFRKTRSKLLMDYNNGSNIKICKDDIETKLKRVREDKLETKELIPIYAIKANSNITRITKSMANDNSTKIYAKKSKKVQFLEDLYISKKKVMDDQRTFLPKLQ